MNVSKITLTLDNGKTVDVTIDASSLVLTSPFVPGDHRIILDAPKSATGPEIAADPGKYDGTPDDVSGYPMPAMFAGNRTAPTWRLAWSYPTPDEYPQCSSLGDAIMFGFLKAKLNYEKLTPGQRGRLGL